MKDFNFDLILFTSGPKAYAPKRIAKECATKNKKFIIIKYKDVNISFKKNDFELNYLGGKMPTSRAIFLRGLGEDPVYSPLKLAITNWYKKNGSKVVNFESYNTWPTLDKITQHINLSKNGLPIVESFTFGSKENLIKWSKDNHPFIAKDVTGSCGVDVFKINSDKDVNDLLEKGYLNNIKIKTFIIQRFLKSGEDLRVIVLGGKALGAMKRIAKKDNFLTNYSQGGSVEKYDLDNDKNAKDIALKVAELFKLDYCGVDLMRDNAGNWIVLEVNRACQFEGFEKSTGVNVADKIVDYLTK